VEAPPRSRSSPSPGVEAESDPWGRARRSLSSEVEVESEPWGRVRRRPSSEAEVESEPWGRARRRPSSEAKAVSEPWGRARRSSSSSGAEGGLSCYQSHSVEWHSSQSDADGAVSLSGRSVERRSDPGHFGSVD
jgi:hypothetical protein